MYMCEHNLPIVSMCKSVCKLYGNWHYWYVCDTSSRYLTLTKSSGQFSSLEKAAIKMLQAHTDTRLFPLDLKFNDKSLFRRLQNACEINFINI